jgi:hypothetical protein
MFMIIFMTSLIKNCKKLTSSLVSFVASDLQVNARCLAKLQPMLVSWLIKDNNLVGTGCSTQQLYILKSVRNTNHLEGRHLFVGTLWDIVNYRSNGVLISMINYCLKRDNDQRHRNLVAG